MFEFSNTNFRMSWCSAPLLEFTGSVAVAVVSENKQPLDVFNIEVNSVHTFRIGHNGVLVHNNNYPSDFLPSGLSGALPDAQKTAWRHNARNLWNSVSRTPASTSFHIHHRVPLEWAHLFPTLNPNRIWNLVGLDAPTHYKVTTARNKWRDSLGRLPSQDEVMDFASSLDEAYYRTFVFPGG